MKKILAICDLEVAYASHFMEHMNNRRRLPFSVQAFSSLEEVEKSVKNQPIEILLISESALDGREEEVGNWPIQQVIVLAEGMTARKSLQYPEVSKYQSSDSVIREVMAVYAAESKEKNPVSVIKKEMIVIGVYSPVGRCLKSTFAMTLGRLLAKEKSVLYVNMESCAGFEELFSKSYDRTLSDVLYHLHEKSPNLIHQISAAVCNMDNLDYIPPVPFPQDLTFVSSQDWDRLIDVIRKESVYEVLILDIGDSIQDVCAVLGMCDRIFMPIKTDFVSESKIFQFERLMEICSYKEVIEKVQKIKLPFCNFPMNRTSYLEQILWSEFGDYVRKLIRKEQL